MDDDLAEDLRATSESIAYDAQRLRDLELEKAALDAQDPRVIDLSEQGRQLAQRLAQSTAMEEQLALQVAHEPGDDALA